MFPISISQMRFGARKAGAVCSSWALACGIPTIPLNGCRRARRCFMRAQFRRSAAIPNSPTSAQLTMRCPNQMKRRLESLVAEHSILYSRARLGFSDFSEEERAQCRRSRRR